MVFLHLPKTGGSWVVAAAAAAGIPLRGPDPLGDQHYSAHGHATLGDVGTDERFSVAFVRHPLDWWRSYWGHRMRAGWDMENGIDRAAASSDLNEFVTRVMERCPGQLDALVDRFVGSPQPQVDFVGRFEHLVQDTCTALRLAGERFAEDAVRGYPKVNANDYGSCPARYRPDVAERLARAERRTIERFYPDDPLPAALIARPPEELDGELGGETSAVAAHPELEQLQLGERVRALERALARSQRSEVTLTQVLAQARTELEETERALETLRASSILRYTRPLRLAYYRTRAHSSPASERPPQVPAGPAQKTGVSA